MSKKKFLLLLIGLISNGYATEYFCPQLPVTVTIGETIDNNWFVWPDNEIISFYKKYYYKLFSEKYTFSHWNGFPHGKNIGGEREAKYFVACCGWVRKNKKLICAYKNIPEEYCVEKVIGTPQKKFICSEQPVDEGLGDSPFHGK